MTRTKTLISIVAILGILASYITPIISSKASAACDPLPSDKGQLTQTVNISTTGTYTLWLRMLTPKADANSTFVKVDDQCHVVAGDGQPGDGFRWINYQGGDTSKALTFNLTAGAHNITLAGREAGTGVDKALLTATNCTPVGMGENCFAAATIQQKSEETETPKSTVAKVLSDEQSTPWIAALCALIIAGAIGVLAWRYYHHLKHHHGAITMPNGTVVGDIHTPRPWDGMLRSLKSFVQHNKLLVGICAGIIIAALTVSVTLAANDNSSVFEAEAGKLTGGAKVIDDGNASGGKYVTFNPNGTTGSQTGGGTGGGSSTGSTGGSNNPSTGGTSGSAQTFPARWSVGAPGVAKYRQSDTSLPVPAGFTVLNPHDTTNKVYNIYTCGNITLDRVYIKGSIYLGTGCYGTVNITNSIIAPPADSNFRAILNNSNGASSLTINISNTTIRPEPVPMGGKNVALTDHVLNDCSNCTIHMNRVDVANSGGMCLCGRNTTIENSWLHDNYIAHLSDPTVAHTGGIFPYGGSGPLTIRYNRLEPGIDAYNGTPVPDYWKAITSVLFTQSSGGSVLRNYVVHDNFISLGGYTVFLQSGENVVFKNNIIGPGHFGRTACSSSCSVTFAEWTNNRQGDTNGTPGAVMPKPW